MELGEFKVYFVQYLSNAGHWYTRQQAHNTFEAAKIAAAEYRGIYDCATRVVKQTTCNEAL